MDPLSDPDEIAKLAGKWPAALTKIFDHFTPIVIGYGGNDGSLMGFLKELPPIEGGVFWCHREGDEIDPAIHEVVEHHHGYLVPIAGFDEVMLLLQARCQTASRRSALRSSRSASLEFLRTLCMNSAKLRVALASLGSSFKAFR